MGSQNAPSAKGQETSVESPCDEAAEGRSLARCDCDGARGCRGRHFLGTDLIRRSFRVQNPLFSRLALLHPELDPGGCEDSPRGGLLESFWIVGGAERRKEEVGGRRIHGVCRKMWGNRRLEIGNSNQIKETTEDRSDSIIHVHDLFPGQLEFMKRRGNLEE